MRWKGKCKRPQTERKQSRYIGGVQEVDDDSDSNDGPDSKDDSNSNNDSDSNMSVDTELNDRVRYARGRVSELQTAKEKAEKEAAALRSALGNVPESVHVKVSRSQLQKYKYEIDGEAEADQYAQLSNDIVWDDTLLLGEETLTLCASEKASNFCVSRGKHDCQKGGQREFKLDANGVGVSKDDRGTSAPARK
eukprot:619899-Prymnesium_polylepis.3